MAVREVPAAVVRVLRADEWRPRARAHADRVEPWVRPHLERRQAGVRHPVEDFLFTYYSFSPAALQRWHPGHGTALVDDGSRGGLTGYAVHDGVAAVTDDHVRARRGPVEGIRRLLTATARRPAHLGCFGLHEWAMVYRQAPDAVRHAAWPLRLGATGTDAVVDSHRVACSHFDAYRFFTPAARPLNRLRPGRDDRAAFEQPGCLHATMDLYKHAFRLVPLVPSELVADCFELAREVRVLDMRASPYDFTALGLTPVRVETPDGKQEYVSAQRGFAGRAAPLRFRLVAECERLLLV